MQRLDLAVDRLAPGELEVDGDVGVGFLATSVVLDVACRLVALHDRRTRGEVVAQLQGVSCLLLDVDYVRRVRPRTKPATHRPIPQR